jgi:hypothetical protein
MEIVGIVVVVIAIGVLVSRYEEKKKLEEMQKNSPEAYVALVKMQHEKEMLEKAQKHERNKTAANIGLNIARWWFR